MRKRGHEISELLVDPRIGSGDLVAPLRLLGIPAIKADPQLEYGDVEMVGVGEGERPVLIGVEIKALGDLLSGIVSKRFVRPRSDGSPGQLEGMRLRFEIPFLLIEGVVTAAPTRELRSLREIKGKPGKFEWREVPGAWERPWTAEQVYSWIHSMQRQGMWPVFTADRRGTVAWLASLWHNWSRGPEEHKSHIAWPEELKAEHALAPELTPVMKVAHALVPGIGIEKARSIEEKFSGVEEMIAASPLTWQEIPGIGRTLAGRIVDTIKRRKDD